MVIAAVLGGGAGRRFGSTLPKQYANLRGVPVIIRSIQAFDKSGEVDEIVAAVPEDGVDFARLLVNRFSPFSVPVRVIAGGSDRGGTLLNILTLLKNENKLADNIILTHDAVRPFINNRIIHENIQAARLHDACCTAIPATDTVFISSDGKFEASIPARSTVFNAQTPQSFNAEKLFSLITSLPSEKYAALTDSCSVFVSFGHKVAIVRGETYNIKITFPEDLLRAELIFDTYFSEGGRQ